MYEYYDQYLKASNDPDAQARWARQLTWEVARHAVGEEIVIYPLMEKHLGEEGKELADNDRDDHQVRLFFNSSSMNLPDESFFLITESENSALEARKTLPWNSRASLGSQRRHGPFTAPQ